MLSSHSSWPSKRVIEVWWPNSPGQIVGFPVSRPTSGARLLSLNLPSMLADDKEASLGQEQGPVGLEGESPLTCAPFGMRPEMPKGIELFFV